MGQKLYSQDETGIKFSSERKPGEVRIPNYVYDIWLPILGSDALAVYTVYCRLEMKGAVKKIKLVDIARACRIGKTKLNKINDKLENCGFVKINKPAGETRLMHWTTEVIVLDPPRKIAQKLIDKYAPSYEILTPWLLGDEDQIDPPEDPNGPSGEPELDPPESPDRPPKIESLDSLQPLDVEKKNTPADFGIGETDPLEGVPQATDGHQQAIDIANGANGSDPVEEIIKHLRWLCVGRDTAMPKGSELGSYRKAAKALLNEKINTNDWQGVCFAIDDWKENPPEEDIWQRDRIRNPHKALDCIATHYWRLKNGGPHDTQQTGRLDEQQQTISDALKARARNGDR